MNRPFDTDHAARELARVGSAALPNTADLAPMHLAAIDDALRAMASPATASRVMVRRSESIWRTRRFAVAMAAAVFVAVPSMAFAGVLPDSVQHAASQAASAVGVTLPDPASDTAKDAIKNAGSNAQAGDNGDDANQDDTGKGLGAATRGTVPGKPEPGEQRGNRFGQVPGGPDQGKAAAAHSGHGPTTTPAHPPTSQRPATPPGHASGSTGGSSTPASTPAPSHASSGGTNNGGGGGQGAAHGKGH